VDEHTEQLRSLPELEGLPVDEHTEQLRSLPWVKFTAATDTGKVRELNEDRYLLEPWSDGNALLAVVADGLGGNQSGEVAAQIAIDKFRELLDRPLPLEMRDRYDFLLNQFYAADTAIRVQSSQSFDLLGMGTTIVAAIFTQTEYLYLYAGDCRFYHFHQTEQVRMSADHTIIRLLLETGRITPDQVATHPMRAIVNSCLGGKNSNGQFAVDPKWNDENPPIYPFSPQDLFLLSSDGLHGSISEHQLQTLIQENLPLAELSSRLLSTALAEDGQDNITFLTIQMNP